MSTNKPSIGAVVLEIAPLNFEKIVSNSNFCKHKSATRVLRVINEIPFLNELDNNIVAIDCNGDVNDFVPWLTPTLLKLTKREAISQHAMPGDCANALAYLLPRKSSIVKTTTMACC